ncbi:disulfide bond formation protein B [Propionivibrio sp.]|uniref:disulfide bond formation protein B n=1 Tax=Propionivibrio sp. TaxID=2212460 RepID=UPI003BEF84AD
MRLSPRGVFALLVTASIGLLATGLLVGELARLHPCHLCNLQRLYYLMLGFFALCGVLLPGWRRLWCVLVGLTALGGVIAAVQQSWMQYVPQESIECGFGDPTLAEQLINWLGTQWPAMFMVTGFCTDKEWIFLGFTLANWSVGCFLGLLGVAVWLGFRRDVA